MTFISDNSSLFNNISIQVHSSMLLKQTLTQPQANQKKNPEKSHPMLMTNLKTSTHRDDCTVDGMVN
jgi:predicted acetyltransferase